MRRSRVIRDPHGFAGGYDSRRATRGDQLRSKTVSPFHLTVTWPERENAAASPVTAAQDVTSASPSGRS